jgi:putative endonuclease
MQRGKMEEDRALAFLLDRGLRLVARNWRCRFGEIDLILMDGPALVFAEVRARRTADFGGAAGSIDRAKQARLQRAAQLYLAQTRSRSPCRFDAILIEGERLDWVRNAFDAQA